jgi:hypothetical protein
LLQTELWYKYPGYPLLESNGFKDQLQAEYIRIIHRDVAKKH